MSARLCCWVLGFLAALMTASTVAVDAFPAARVLVAAGVTLSIGLIAEILNSRRSRQLASRLVADREADGRVDIATLLGVRREPNRDDKRFGAFVGLEPGPPLTRKNATKFNSRRSPPLLGKVAIVSLFIGRNGRAWSERELADAHVELIRAGEWIEREAQRHGARVNVELANTYFVFDDEEREDVAITFQAEGEDVGPIEHGASLKALARASRAASALGFNDASDLFSKVGSLLDVDEAVWLIHPRQAGRSFALSREDSGWEGVSMAICYPREASFPERLTGPASVDPVTVVHEFLHLFGETDKYGRSLRTFALKSVTRREVMRLDETSLRRLRVDPSTAAELGWRFPGD